MFSSPLPRACSSLVSFTLVAVKRLASKTPSFAGLLVHRRVITAVSTCSTGAASSGPTLKTQWRLDSAPVQAISDKKELVTVGPNQIAAGMSPLRVGPPEPA